MAGIVEMSRTPTFVEGKANEVVALTEAKILAVAFVDADGKKSTALAIVFGTDTEDNAPGVFIMANEQQMREQLRVANPLIKKGVREYLAGRKAVKAEDIPEAPTSGLGYLDLGQEGQ